MAPLLLWLYIFCIHHATSQTSEPCCALEKGYIIPDNCQLFYDVNNADDKGSNPVNNACNSGMPCNCSFGMFGALRGISSYTMGYDSWINYTLRLPYQGDGISYKFDYYEVKMEQDNMCINTDLSFIELYDANNQKWIHLNDSMSNAAIEITAASGFGTEFKFKQTGSIINDIIFNKIRVYLRWNGECGATGMTKITYTPKQMEQSLLIQPGS